MKILIFFIRNIYIYFTKVDADCPLCTPYLWPCPPVLLEFLYPLLFSSLPTNINKNPLPFHAYISGTLIPGYQIMMTLIQHKTYPTEHLLILPTSYPPKSDSKHLSRSKSLQRRQSKSWTLLTQSTIDMRMNSRHDLGHRTMYQTSAARQTIPK